MRCAVPGAVRGPSSRWPCVVECHCEPRVKRTSSSRRHLERPPWQMGERYSARAHRRVWRAQHKSRARSKGARPLATARRAGGSGARGTTSGEERRNRSDQRGEQGTGRSGSPRGAWTPHAPRASRRVLRAPRVLARGARAPGARRRAGWSGARGVASDEGREEARRKGERHRTRADRERQGRAALGLPARRARHVALGARPRARPRCARPPPARGRGEGAARARSDGRNERRTEEEKSTAALERPCATTAVINHPRCTRAARVALASPVAPRAPPSLRTERRPKRRRETRTTTGDGTREE